jgi:hypothetical protein
MLDACISPSSNYGYVYWYERISSLRRFSNTLTLTNPFGFDYIYSRTIILIHCCVACASRTLPEVSEVFSRGLNIYIYIYIYIYSFDYIYSRTIILIHCCVACASRTLHEVSEVFSRGLNIYSFIIYIYIYILS